MQRVRPSLLVIAHIAVLRIASWCSAADTPVAFQSDESGFTSVNAEYPVRPPGLNGEWQNSPRFAGDANGNRPIASEENLPPGGVQRDLSASSDAPPPDEVEDIESLFFLN